MCHVGMPCWGCAPMRPIVQYKFPVPAPAPTQAQTDNVNCKAHGTTQSTPKGESQILPSKTCSSPLFMMGNGGQRGRYQNSTCRPQATPQVNCKNRIVECPAMHHLHALISSRYQAAGANSAPCFQREGGGECVARSGAPGPHERKDLSHPEKDSPGPHPLLDAVAGARTPGVD